MKTPDERIEKYRNVTDLKKQFSRVYRARDDGTGDSERIERIWGMEIPGRHGAISPAGFNGDLGVRTASSRTARKLSDLGLRPMQRGDECSFRFPVAKIHEVAAIIRAKKRRQVTPEQREALADRLARARNAARPTDSKAVSTAQEGTSQS